MEKYILITGATSGFGLACAHKYVANGWNLILTGRRKQRLDQLKKEITSENDVEVIILNFDVRKRADVAAHLNSLAENVRANILILINNAGLAVGRSALSDGDPDDWDTMIDTNVKGLLYVSKIVIPWLKTNKKGHIVNIASIAGKEVYPAGNVYCATKHAVDALSQAMRIELVSDNIKVTTIAPGAADTEFSLVRFKGDKNTADAVYDGFQPLSAEDIAETIFFVTSTPAHVNINDLTIMPTAQATSTIFHKS